LMGSDGTEAFPRPVCHATTAIYPRGVETKRIGPGHADVTPCSPRMNSDVF
jgi:hypothetical protein